MVAGGGEVPERSCEIWGSEESRRTRAAESLLLLSCGTGRGVSLRKEGREEGLVLIPTMALALEREKRRRVKTLNTLDKSSIRVSRRTAP